MSKKWQRSLHSLFTMKDLSRFLLTSQKKLKFHPLNLPDTDFNDNEDYDEGFEDEDYD